MLVLGITGGVATGKSTVARMFADLGAPTISADAIAHDLLGPGTDVSRHVRSLFHMGGSADEAIDRQALGRIVFADGAARARLEAIMHPPIVSRLKAQIDSWRVSAGPALAAAEIPLLFEAGLEDATDHIVVVACAEATQLARIRERRDLSLPEARRIAGAQWSLEKKIARAHSVIRTDDGLDDTRRQVSALWERLAAA